MVKYTPGQLKELQYTRTIRITFNNKFTFAADEYWIKQGSETLKNIIDGDQNVTEFNINLPCDNENYFYPVVNYLKTGTLVRVSTYRSTEPEQRIMWIHIYLNLDYLGCDKFLESIKDDIVDHMKSYVELEAFDLLSEEQVKSLIDYGLYNEDRRQKKTLFLTNSEGKSTGQFTSFGTAILDWMRKRNLLQFEHWAPILIFDQLLGSRN